MDELERLELLEDVLEKFRVCREEMRVLEPCNVPQMLINIRVVWELAVENFGCNHVELCSEFNRLLPIMESKLREVHHDHRRLDGLVKLDKLETTRFFVGALELISSCSQAWREEWSNTLRRNRIGTLVALGKHWKGEEMQHVCQWIDKGTQGTLNLPHPDILFEYQVPDDLL